MTSSGHGALGASGALVGGAATVGLKLRKLKRSVLLAHEARERNADKILQIEKSLRILLALLRK